jgi:hypothetical protein
LLLSGAPNPFITLNHRPIMMSIIQSECGEYAGILRGIMSLSHNTVMIWNRIQHGLVNLLIEDVIQWLVRTIKTCCEDMQLDLILASKLPPF